MKQTKTIRVRKEVHDKAKVHCVKKGREMGKWTEEAIVEKIKKEK